MDSDIGLEALFARYQQGDLAAATALVNHLSPALHRFFLLKFVSRSFADDLLQDTWMRIHEVRHTHRPGEPVRPWIYAIARNVQVDHYRKAQRSALREHPLNEATDLPSLPVDASNLDALLADLPESQREVIAMLKIGGMSLEEVARATSSSVGSVKQKAHRAYARLRERIAGLRERRAS